MITGSPDNKPGIDFNEISQDSPTIKTQKSVLLNKEKFSQEEAPPKERVRNTRKIKDPSLTEETLEKLDLTCEHSFSFSLQLLNLFRDPDIHDHCFSVSYLDGVARALRSVSRHELYDTHVLYLHLILAQIQKLHQMEEVECWAGQLKELNIEKWNTTNVMKTQCILFLLRGHLNSSSEGNLLKGPLSCHLMKEKEVVLLQKGCFRISTHFIRLALCSRGHWDIYFGPLLLNQFNYEAKMWFNKKFTDTSIALENYARIFRQVSLESKHYERMDWQEWYKQQVANIVKGEFHPEDVIGALNYTSYNPWVERLLIGLQGWQSDTGRAIKYLNVFIDDCDWQQHQAYNSSVAVTGDSFSINYLIDDMPKHKESLALCLKAPCLNPHYSGEFYSWHLPKSTKYVSDEENYLWISQNFGAFTKSGFYDWALFSLKDKTKDSVNKILNVAIRDKLEKEKENDQKGAISIRSVKGRIIVQPRGTRQLCLHEIYLDSIYSDQGVYKTPTFTDAFSELEKCAQLGINCVYLVGVFERDNDPRAEVYRKPNASPLAVTHRTMICQMLGGKEEFKKLVRKGHDLGLKIVVDVSARISSSRMAKKYESLRLRSVDGQGRINYHYGCNGRSNSFEDTTPLNYRKKEAWDMLVNQVLEIIEEYQVDGIYLDNGFQWPPLFQINKEEMLRLQLSDHRPVYSLTEIFQGQIVDSTKSTGFWNSKYSLYYPNPILTKLTKTIWQEYPYCHVFTEGLEIDDAFRGRVLSVIRSGPIPRMFKLPKALGQVGGMHLHNNGEITGMKQVSINALRKWYEDFLKALPRGTIMIHSTTSPVWPFLSYLFKKATWAIVDLYYFLPALVMTSGLEHVGRAYKTKSIGINYLPPDSSEYQSATKNTTEHNLRSFARANSSFFHGGGHHTMVKGKVVNCLNTTLKDPSQIRALQQIFRKDVGPEFGFDLHQIHKHYAHRRELRANNRLLREGHMVTLTAQHIYGKHSSVLSFARYNEEGALLVSINFNNDAVDMHYNLSSLKILFRHWERSGLVVQIQDILHPDKFKEEYYLVPDLINSKIEARIESYKTIIWKLTPQEGKEKQAIECSNNRIKDRLSRNPPAWIYSSVFFNELNHLLDNAKTKMGIVSGLNKLYEYCIQPNKFNLSLVISKSYQFYANKHKLQKLFGVFRLVSEHPQLESTLKGYIQGMLQGNTLGPIAFATPEIGSWSSVGGLGVMVDELSKELAKLGEDVYLITPYYEYNKKKQTNYLAKDGFHYTQNIRVSAAHFTQEFGIHRGKWCGVNYVWFHNPELFSRPYEGQSAFYVSKQLVFFALATLQSFCQLKIFPSICVTNDWMCGFVSAYVKCNKYKDVFNGTKFMHICHNLDPLYEGRLYPKVEEGNLNWLIQLPPEWYIEHRNNRMVINPSRCALETCDNWGTVSHSYKVDLLKESPLAGVLWKHPHPFSFPNGIRKDQRFSILLSKTPGNHIESKRQLQQKYFRCPDLRDDIPLLSFIGRVTKQKGVHLILDVIESLIIERGKRIQFLVGGMASSKEEYGKYCADKMRYLNHKYPDCFWSDPDMFFSDGPLVNFGSDFALMPSQFEPGGIVQHEFFCAYTPVIAFRTGGLKDSVFQYNSTTKKGNGFNFMSYDHQDFKQCLRRALNVYENRQAYLKLRENAFDSVIEEEDVAKGWNNEFYRMQNKIYIDWMRVQHQTEKLTQSKQEEAGNDVELLQWKKGEYWSPIWRHIDAFKQVLKNASRLKVKAYSFVFETKRIPRPKEVLLWGSWDNWKKEARLNFDKIQKNYKVSLKLQPGTYLYKYTMDGEWALSEIEESEADAQNNFNHVAQVE